MVNLPLSRNLNPFPLSCVRSALSLKQLALPIEYRWTHRHEPHFFFFLSYCVSNKLINEIINYNWFWIEHLRFLLAVVAAAAAATGAVLLLGSLCECFICSISASAPRNSLWQIGQDVAFGPPINAACCCKTPKCSCSSCNG